MGKRRTILPILYIILVLSGITVIGNWGEKERIQSQQVYGQKCKKLGGYVHYFNVKHNNKICMKPGSILEIEE